MKNEFNEVTLNDICSIKGRIGWRGLKSSEYTKNGYPILTSYNLVNVFNGIDYTIKINRIPKWRYEESPDIKIQNEDILISKISGEVGYVNNLPEKSTVNSTITIIRITENSKVLSKFIYYFLKSNRFKKFFAQNTKGSTMSSVNHSSLKKIKIILPPIKLQKKIVSILEKAEKAIDLRRDADDLTDVILKSIFVKMFYKNKFTTQILDKLCSKISSGSTPPGGSKNYSKNGDILFIRSQNIRMNKFSDHENQYIPNEIHNKMKRTWVIKSDVLLNITGASIGRTAVYLGDDNIANVNQHVCIVRIKDFEEINPIYLNYYLSSDKIQQHIKSINAGGTREALNLSQIKKFEIPMPPISLQQKFASIVNGIENIKACQGQSKRQIQDLNNIMSQKAFKGELVC